MDCPLQNMFAICEVMGLCLLGFWQLIVKEMLELEANMGFGKATNMSPSFFGSALGAIGAFTSLSVPSAFLADSSVT